MPCEYFVRLNFSAIQKMHRSSQIFSKSERAAQLCTDTCPWLYYISALVVFNVEPDSFNSFFDAIYWATVSLTTMGYGDIYPVTEIGRVVTMISSLFGIAIVALPAGIITAGYMDELNNVAKLKVIYRTGKIKFFDFLSVSHSPSPCTAVS